MGKLAGIIKRLQAGFECIPQEQRDKAEKGLDDVTYQDLAMYQEEQSKAHASGILTLDDANLIYNAVGPGCSVEHWRKNSLATKYAINVVIAHLIKNKTSLDIYV